MSKKVALHNLGCKVNSYELEAMQQLLEANNYEIVEFAPGADIYVINTCTVTNIADRKSRQMLHKAKKMNPNAIVVAAGCYVQAAKEKLEVDEAIDLVIGNNMKKNLVNILREYESNQDYSSSIIDIDHTHEYEELQISKTAEHTRAYIKVQDGCNQFCSYCIIPFARGRVRSRSKEDVIREITRLAQEGYKEVVLTGIHLSSYGVDIDGEQENLLSLIKSVHTIEGLERIRLGSLEPGIITEEFVEEVAKLPKFCPHFHLSLQSGCDTTLKRMNRRYDSKRYYQGCQLLRKYFKNPAITTDIIVGFPGETQQEFEESKAFVEKVEFFETHIFKYSKREGTKAAVMEHQVSEDIKNIRSQQLIALGKAKQTAYLEGILNQEVEILIEEKVIIEDCEYQVGHTKEYVKACIKSEVDYSNQIIKVRLEKLLKDGVILCSL